LVGVRLPAKTIKAVDAWTKKSGARSRSNAIRQIIDLGLPMKSKGKSRK